MKKILLIIYILTQLFITNAQVYNANREYFENDPNRNPDWEWWTGESETIYYITESQSGSVNSINTILPWFSDVGPASVLNTHDPATKDMYPCDGWVLLSRDFGTSSTGTLLPRFVLYNKYKGLLRLFFLNIFDESHSYFLVRLSFQDESKTTSNFAFNSDDKAFINEYENKQSEISVCKSSKWQWSYVDFNVFGYDPNPTANSAFWFDFQGINEGDIQIEGEVGNLTDENTTGLVGFDKVVKTVDDGYALANKYFKNAEGFKKNMLSKGEDNTKWYSNLLLTIGNSAIQDAAPIIGAAAGIIQSFIGNSKSAQSRTKYDVKLNGTITFNYQYPQFSLLIPGSSHSDLNDASMPLYDTHLGVFNMSDRPVIRYGYMCESAYFFYKKDDFGNNIPYISLKAHMIFKINDDIDKSFLINNQSDIKVSDIEFGFCFEDRPTQFYKVNTFNDKAIDLYRTIDFPFQHDKPNGTTINNCNCVSSIPNDLKEDLINIVKTVKIAVKMKVEPLCNSNQTEPVWVTKTYKPNTFIETSIFEPSQNELTLYSGYIDYSKNYYATNLITVGGNETTPFTIANQSTVSFSTRNEILFLPGFAVEPNSDFEASIVGDHYYENYLYNLTNISCGESPVCYSDNYKNKMSKNIKQHNIEDNKIVNDISIFPNPNNGTFTLSMNNDAQELNYIIELFDYSGKLIYRKPNCDKYTQEIYIDSNQNGLFLLRVIQKNNITLKKIIKY